MGKFEEKVRRHETRNFWSLILFDSLFRIGWLFKTESLVIPALASELTDSALIIGLFPMISRVAQHLAPLFMGRIAESKKRLSGLYLGTHLGSALSWGLLAAMLAFRSGLPGAVVLWVFLGLYGLFWVSRGSYRLLEGTLRGKLLRPEIRGRLMFPPALVSTVFAVPAGLLIRYVLKGEGSDDPLSFFWIFLAASVFFALATVGLLFLREPSSPRPRGRQPLLRYIRNGLVLLRRDHDFLRVTIARILYGAHYGMLAFYTVYGKKELGISMENIGWFIIAQRGGNAVSTFFLGRLADAKGNRLVMKIFCGAVMLAPWTAILVGKAMDPVSPLVYCFVYFLVGFVLPFMTNVTNYVLEIAPMEKHASYLSTINLAVVVTALWPLLMGFLIDRIGYVPVFAGASVLFLIAGVIVFTLREPRHHRPELERREVPLG